VLTILPVWCILETVAHAQHHLQVANSCNHKGMEGQDIALCSLEGLQR
jgi:hypothetical protein